MERQASQEHENYMSLLAVEETDTLHTDKAHTIFSANSPERVSVRTPFFIGMGLPLEHIAELVGKTGNQ